MSDSLRHDDRPVLAVVAKPPVIGAVKTRLAATIGPRQARDTYARTLLSTLDQAEEVEADLVLALAEDGSGEPGAADLAAGRARPWRLVAQRGHGLGERLARLFDDLFADGATAVAIVNSDSPAMPADYMRSALARAGNGRLVLGPAADGGYYAIAVSGSTWQSHGPTLGRALAGIEMSTSATFAATVRRAAALGLGVEQLPLWIDVDTAADLPALERLAPAGAAAPRLRGEPLAGLREIYLHITHRCGCTCPHCYNRANAWDADELTTAEWKDAVDQCVALGASSFVFIGGDPFLRDDLLDLIDHVTGAREAKARFFFNSFVSEEFAAELAAAGHGRLRALASVDGPELVNDDLRGPGNHAAVMASIHNLIGVGLTPVVNTVLLLPVLPSLPEHTRGLRATGVERLHFILPHQRGALLEHDDLVPDGSQMLAGLRAAREAASEVGLFIDNFAAWRRRLKTPQDFCNAGCKDIAIDPYGRVYACMITVGDPAFVAGDLRERDMEGIWRGSAGLRLLRAARARDRAECAACPVVDACGGECWMQAHYAARALERPAGLTAPFPYCDLVRPVFEELARAAAAAGEPTVILPSDAGAALAPPSPGLVGAAVACDGSADTACEGQAAAGDADYTLFDCI